MAVTPDLAGLSLGGAYQAGLAAGFARFRITAYRQTWMVNPLFLFREIAPAPGYVAQTSTPGSGGAVTPDTPPEGSFYTLHPEPGVPDQMPGPGEPVLTDAVLSFVYQVPDHAPDPVGVARLQIDPDTGVTAWWEYVFNALAVPDTLLADLHRWNGPPLPPVDVEAQEWAHVAADPLRIFTDPPELLPDDLIDDVPQFERKSHEIRAVLKAVANEFARLDAARRGLLQNWFPLTADVLLWRWEDLLGIRADPDADLDSRRALVIAYLQRLKGQGRGRDWTDAMNRLVGNATDWSVFEEYWDYTLRMELPERVHRTGWRYTRDITPAHLAINGDPHWRVGIAYLDYTLLL